METSHIAISYSAQFTYLIHSILHRLLEFRGLNQMDVLFISFLGYLLSSQSDGSAQKIASLNLPISLGFDCLDLITEAIIYLVLSLN